MKNNSSNFILSVAVILLIATLAIVSMIGYLVFSGKTNIVVNRIDKPKEMNMCVLNPAENTVCINGVIKKANPEFKGSTSGVPPYVNVVKGKETYCTCKDDNNPLSLSPKVVQGDKLSKLEQLKAELPTEAEIELKQLKMKYDDLLKELDICHSAVTDVAATNNLLVEKLNQEVKEAENKIQQAKDQMTSAKNDLDKKTKRLKEVESLLKQKEAQIKKLQKGKK